MTANEQGAVRKNAPAMSNSPARSAALSTSSRSIARPSATRYTRGSRLSLSTLAGPVGACRERLHGDDTTVPSSLRARLTLADYEPMSATIGHLADRGLRRRCLLLPRHMDPQITVLTDQTREEDQDLLRMTELLLALS